MNQKEPKVKTIDYEMLNFDYILENVTTVFLDEITQKQIHSVKKDELDHIYSTLKAYQNIFFSAGQKKPLESCKSLLRMLKQLKRVNNKGFNELILKSSEDKICNLQTHTGVIPSRVLKKISDHYFFFQDFYIIEKDNYSLLVGKIKHWDFVRTHQIVFCYIDKFITTCDLEEDFKLQQKLYNICRIKRIFNKNLKHLIVFLLVLFLILAFKLPLYIFILFIIFYSAILFV